MLNSRVIAAVFLSAIVVSTVEAGVTIHYEGKAKSRAAATQALQVARAEARRLNWVVEDANASSAHLTRVIAEKERLYTGRVAGIVIRPGPMCDPFYIQFGDDLFLQDFVKTQFAGPDVHIAIVKLLKKIAAYFNRLSVEDEGEYWETNNRATLKKHIAVIDKMIDAAVAGNPRARTRVKMPDGRIIDLIQ
jgi:hypothetical protein